MWHFELVENQDEAPESAADLLSTWLQFNTAGDRPTRNDFTPFSLKTWLGNIDIYDVEDSGGNFRVRLNGTEVVAITGEDWTGKTARDIDARFGCRLHDDLFGVFTSKQPLGQHIRIFQKDYVPAYRLLLPVFSDAGDGEVVQVFLALFASSQ